MKNEKKRPGTKAQIRLIKERERRIATAVFLSAILVAAIISSYLIITSLTQNRGKTVQAGSSQPKAAVVDQLGLTFPNQTFSETARDILKQAGYLVDYYPSASVTVEFYRYLPTCDYDVIILRVHSLVTINDGERLVVLFTSQPYSKAGYSYERSAGQVGKVQYQADDQDAYFGISQKFVRSSLQGRFGQTIVIMMGCEGIRDSEMAEAFIEKGVEAYIGWDKKVSAPHTDQATIQLLRHMITEKRTVREAVDEVMEEIGPDPVYKSILGYYPPMAKNTVARNANQ